MVFKGSPFTWKKKISDGHSIWERLERSLSNNNWLIQFGGSTVHHLNNSTSDHLTLWILADGLKPINPTKPFCFKEMWLAKKGNSNTIKYEWSKHKISYPTTGIVPKIKECGKALQQWSRRIFGNVRRELQHKQNLLTWAELGTLILGVSFWVRMLRCEVNDLLDKKTRM